MVLTSLGMALPASPSHRSPRSMASSADLRGTALIDRGLLGTALAASPSTPMAPSVQPSRHHPLRVAFAGLPYQHDPLPTLLLGGAWSTRPLSPMAGQRGSPCAEGIPGSLCNLETPGLKAWMEALAPARTTQSYFTDRPVPTLPSSVYKRQLRPNPRLLLRHDLRLYPMTRLMSSDSVHAKTTSRPLNLKKCRREGVSDT